VRNQAFSSPTTPRFTHTGEKNRGGLEHSKMSGDQKTDVLEDHPINPVPAILV